MWAMVGPPGRSNTEFLGVFSNVGFCCWIDPTASGAFDVFLHDLGKSFYAVL